MLNNGNSIPGFDITTLEFPIPCDMPQLDRFLKYARDHRVILRTLFLKQLTQTAVEAGPSATVALICPLLMALARDDVPLVRVVLAEELPKLASYLMRFPSIPLESFGRQNSPTSSLASRYGSGFSTSSPSNSWVGNSGGARGTTMSTYSPYGSSSGGNTPGPVGLPSPSNSSPALSRSNSSNSSNSSNGSPSSANNNNSVNRRPHPPNGPPPASPSNSLNGISPSSSPSSTSSPSGEHTQNGEFGTTMGTSSGGFGTFFQNLGSGISAVIGGAKGTGKGAKDGKSAALAAKNPKNHTHTQNQNQTPTTNGGFRGTPKRSLAASSSVGSTPLSTPGTTPASTPGSTPTATPGSTPSSTPNSTPRGSFSSGGAYLTQSSSSVASTTKPLNSMSGQGNSTYVLAENNTVVYTSGYDVILSHILPAIIYLIRDPVPRVREEMCEAFVRIAAHLEEEDIVQHCLFPILTLAHEGTEEQHVTSLKVLHELSPILGPPLCGSLVAAELSCCSDDSSIRLRHAAATCFGKICIGAGTRVTETRLLPFFARLCADPMWSIRRATVESVSCVLHACSPEVAAQKITFLIHKLGLDPSRWVKNAVLAELGRIVFACPPSLHDADAGLLRFYSLVAESGREVDQEVIVSNAFCFLGPFLAALAHPLHTNQPMFILRKALKLQDKIWALRQAYKRGLITSDGEAKDVSKDLPTDSVVFDSSTALATASLIQNLDEEDDFDRLFDRIMKIPCPTFPRDGAEDEDAIIDILAVSGTTAGSSVIPSFSPSQDDEAKDAREGTQFRAGGKVTKSTDDTSLNGTNTGSSQALGAVSDTKPVSSYERHDCAGIWEVSLLTSSESVAKATRGLISRFALLESTLSRFLNDDNEKVRLPLASAFHVIAMSLGQYLSPYVIPHALLAMLRDRSTVVRTRALSRFAWTLSSVPPSRRSDFFCKALLDTESPSAARHLWRVKVLLVRQLGLFTALLSSPDVLIRRPEELLFNTILEVEAEAEAEAERETEIEVETAEKDKKTKIKMKDNRSIWYDPLSPVSIGLRDRTKVSLLTLAKWALNFVDDRVSRVSSEAALQLPVLLRALYAFDEQEYDELRTVLIKANPQLTPELVALIPSFRPLSIIDTFCELARSRQLREDPLDMFELNIATNSAVELDEAYPPRDSVRVIIERGCLHRPLPGSTSPMTSENSDVDGDYNSDANEVLYEEIPLHIPEGLVDSPAVALPSPWEFTSVRLLGLLRRSPPSARTNPSFSTRVSFLQTAVASVGVLPPRAFCALFAEPLPTLARDAVLNVRLEVVSFINHIFTLARNDARARRVRAVDCVKKIENTTKQVEKRNDTDVESTGEVEGDGEGEGETDVDTESEHYNPMQSPQKRFSHPNTFDSARSVSSKTTPGMVSESVSEAEADDTDTDLEGFGRSRRSKAMRRCPVASTSEPASSPAVRLGELEFEPSVIELLQSTAPLRLVELDSHIDVWALAYGLAEVDAEEKRFYEAQQEEARAQGKPDFVIPELPPSFHAEEGLELTEEDEGHVARSLEMMPPIRDEIPRFRGQPGYEGEALCPQGTIYDLLVRIIRERRRDTDNEIRTRAREVIIPSFPEYCVAPQAPLGHTLPVNSITTPHSTQVTGDILVSPFAGPTSSFPQQRETVRYPRAYRGYSCFEYERAAASALDITHIKHPAHPSADLLGGVPQLTPLLFSTMGVDVEALPRSFWTRIQARADSLTPSASLPIRPYTPNGPILSTFSPASQARVRAMLNATTVDKSGKTLSITKPLSKATIGMKSSMTSTKTSTTASSFNIFEENGNNPAVDWIRNFTLPKRVDPELEQAIQNAKRSKRAREMFEGTPSPNAGTNTTSISSPTPSFSTQGIASGASPTVVPIVDSNSTHSNIDIIGLESLEDSEPKSDWVNAPFLSQLGFVSFPSSSVTPNIFEQFVSHTGFLEESLAKVKSYQYRRAVEDLFYSVQYWDIFYARNSPHVLPVVHAEIAEQKMIKQRALHAFALSHGLPAGLPYTASQVQNDTSEVPPLGVGVGVGAVAATTSAASSTAASPTESAIFGAMNSLSGATGAAGVATANKVSSSISLYADLPWTDVLRSFPMAELSPVVEAFSNTTATISTQSRLSTSSLESSIALGELSFRPVSLGSVPGSGDNSISDDSASDLEARGDLDELIALHIPKDVLSSMASPIASPASVPFDGKSSSEAKDKVGSVSLSISETLVIPPTDTVLDQPHLFETRDNVDILPSVILKNILPEGSFDRNDDTVKSVEVDGEGEIIDDDLEWPASPPATTKSPEAFRRDLEIEVEKTISLELSLGDSGSESTSSPTNAPKTPKTPKRSPENSFIGGEVITGNASLSDFDSEQVHRIQLALSRRRATSQSSQNLSFDSSDDELLSSSADLIDINSMMALGGSAPSSTSDSFPDSSMSVGGSENSETERNVSMPASLPKPNVSNVDMYDGTTVTETPSVVSSATTLSPSDSTIPRKGSFSSSPSTGLGLTRRRSVGSRQDLPMAEMANHSFPTECLRVSLPTQTRSRRGSVSSPTGANVGGFISSGDASATISFSLLSNEDHVTSPSDDILSISLSLTAQPLSRLRRFDEMVPDENDGEGVVDDSDLPLDPTTSTSGDFRDEKNPDNGEALEMANWDETAPPNFERCFSPPVTFSPLPPSALLDIDTSAVTSPKYSIFASQHTLGDIDDELVAPGDLVSDSVVGPNITFDSRGSDSSSHSDSIIYSEFSQGDQGDQGNATFKVHSDPFIEDDVNCDDDSSDSGVSV